MNTKQTHNAAGYWSNVLQIGLLLCMLLYSSTPATAKAQARLPSPFQTERQRADPSAEAHVERGAALLDEGAYDEAIAAFDQALMIDADHARAYALRGQAYWLNDELEQALADLDRALALAPTEADTYRIRGAVYADLGQYPEALQDFDEALRLKPQVAWTLAHRGHTHYLADNFDAALADLNEATRLNPQYVWAIVARGVTYNGMADYTKALLDLSRALSLAPDNEWALATRGSVYRALEEYEKAIADLSSALEVSPTYVWARTERGRTYQEMGNTEQALADYDQAIEQDPTYDWAWARRGLLYFESKQYDAALADFSEALAIDPQYDWALSKRGETYQALEEYDAALADFTAATALKPANGRYYALRADLLRITKHYDEALTDADQAVTLAPDDEFVWAVRGYIYRMMERYEEALADFTYALELDSTYTWAYTMRGEIYQLLGRDEEALADFEQANALQGSETVSAPIAVATEEPEPTATPEAPAAGVTPESPVAIFAQRISASADAAQSLAAAQEAVIQIAAVGSFTGPNENAPRVQAGRGSGFILDPSGIAVTNNHVVTGAALLKVYVDGYDQPLNARVLGVSECADLAVIDLEGEGFSYLNWYDGDVAVGLDVYAAGYPLGDPEYTLTRGIIAKARANGQSPWASLERVLQHDADIHPGNSGGPLLTAQGQVVGVNYASNAQFRQSFAIGLAEAMPIIEQLRLGNDVDSLGINGEAFSNGEDFSGIWVYSVKSGSPADQAGIQGGDFILTLESLPMAADGTMRTYCDVLRSHSAEDTLDVEIFRPASSEFCTGQFNGRLLACRTLEGAPTVEEAQPSSTPTGDAQAIQLTTVQHDSGQFAISLPRGWTDRQSTVNNDSQQLIALSETDSSGAVITLFLNQQANAGNLGNALDEIHQKLQEDAPETIAACTYGTRDTFSKDQVQGAFDQWINCGTEQTQLFTVVMRPTGDQAYYLYFIIVWNPDWDLDYLAQMLDSLVVHDLAMAVVQSRTLNVRSGPGTNYGVIGQLNSGMRLNVVAQAYTCAWLQVQLADGRQGWIAGQAPYAALEGNCALIPQGTFGAAPVASGGGSGGTGCILFQNHFNDEATVTLTSKDGQWNKTFKVGRKANYRECVSPGSYTYTIDVPPPWGSVNGELTISRGRTITFPIYGN
ncbi:MAG: tetratricopeptide repeat protein [Caldilineaceae bacterium]